MKIDLYCQRCIDYVDILLGIPPLGVYNRNTVSENGDFLALCVNIFGVSAKVAPFQPAIPARKQNLTPNSPSRSFKVIYFGVGGKATGD